MGETGPKQGHRKETATAAGCNQTSPIKEKIKKNKKNKTLFLKLKKWGYLNPLFSFLCEMGYTHHTHGTYGT